MSKRFKELKKAAVPANPNKGWLKTANEIVASKPWRKDAVIIALKVMDALDELGITQKQLAEKLSVSPQAVNKIVKGKQNLTIGTIRRLEEALDVSLISLKHHDKKPQYRTKLIPWVIRYNSTSMKVFSGNINTLERINARSSKSIVRKLILNA